ncbi:hypothetical protein SLA2020_279880 [Shorea laevis]
MSSTFLPEELLLNILSRLSPKSIFRFRCVCKTWNTLIGNPNFLNRSILREPNRPAPLLFFTAKHRTVDNWNHIFYFLSDETLECQSQIILKVNYVFNNFTIVASCNGLLCLRLHIDDQIYLWNPATSEAIKPPSPRHPRSQFDKHMEMKFGAFLITVGFGFDRRSNDFKVLRICNVVRNNHNKRCYYDRDPGSNLRMKGSKRQVEVYSLKTGKWRRLDLRVPFDELYLRGLVDPVPYFPTTAFDGFFFWWVLPTKHYDKEEIVAFDFSNELFRTTPLPDGAHFSDFSSVHFTVLNGSLAIVGFPKETN